MGTGTSYVAYATRLRTSTPVTIHRNSIAFNEPILLLSPTSTSMSFTIVHLEALTHLDRRFSTAAQEGLAKMLSQIWHQEESYMTALWSTCGRLISIQASSTFANHFVQFDLVTINNCKPDFFGQCWKMSNLKATVGLALCKFSGPETSAKYSRSCVFSSHFC